MMAAEKLYVQQLEDRQRVLKRRYKKQPKKRSKQYLAIAIILSSGLLLVFVFMQIMQLSTITSNAKRIDTLKQDLLELTSEQQNLEVELGKAYNLEQISAVATDRLGMVHPVDSQIVVVKLQAVRESRSSQGYTLQDVQPEGGIFERILGWLD